MREICSLVVFGDRTRYQLWHILALSRSPSDNSAVSLKVAGVRVLNTLHSCKTLNNISF